MSVLELHIAPENDPLGTPIESYDDTDLIGDGDAAYKMRLSLFDLGSGQFRLPRSLWEASSLNPRESYYVRVHIPYIDNTNPFFGIWLLAGSFVLASPEERGGEIVTIGGPGPMHYLRRAIIPYQPWDSANAEVVDGTWYFEDQSHGEVMQRLINQDGDSDYPALPDMVSSSFNVSTDTNGDAWPANNGIIALQRGIDYLEALRTLQRSGSLDAWMTGNLNLRLFGSDFGEDRTGTAYGTGVVRFVGSQLTPSPPEPRNVISDLVRRRDAGRRVTHVLAVGRDKRRDGQIIEGKPIHAWFVADTWSSGDPIRQGYIEYDTNNMDILERAARRYMRETRNKEENQAEFAVKPGQDESTGLYLPGSVGTDRGNWWFGDSVTLKTGGGNDLDFNDFDTRIAAFRMELNEAAGEGSAEEKEKSWDIVVETGYDAQGDGALGNSETQQGSICRCGNPHEFAPQCDEPAGDTLIADTDDAGWIGSLESGDGFTGDHRATGASGGISGAGNQFSITPGQSYLFIMRLGGSAHKYTGYIRLEDTPDVLPALDTLFVDQVVPGGHGDVSTFSTTFTAPAGYNVFRFRHLSKFGGWRYQAELYAVSSGTEDDDCIDYDGLGLPHASRYTLPMDTILELIDRADNLHPVLQSTYTNTSGAAVSAGDVVVLDTAADNSFKTTATAAESGLTIRVAAEDIADAADGEVAGPGDVIGINVNGTPAVGDYLFTSTTPGAADADPVRDEGAFGQIIGIDGSVVTAAIWGQPDGAGGSSGSVATDTIWDAKGDLAGGTGADTAARLPVGSNGQKLTARSSEVTGLKWESDTRVISFHIDGGGSAITTGVKGDLYIPFACTITGWTLLEGSGTSTSSVLDVWLDTYTNFEPTAADSIAGSEKPTITTAKKGQDLSLSTWTTAVPAGSILRFNVDSNDNAKRLELFLTVVVA